MKTNKTNKTRSKGVENIKADIRKKLKPNCKLEESISWLVEKFP